MHRVSEKDGEGCESEKEKLIKIVEEKFCVSFISFLGTSFFLRKRVRTEKKDEWEKKGKKYANLILWKCGEKVNGRRKHEGANEWSKKKPERSFKFADTETQ